jgi:hypothetical protein
MDSPAETHKSQLDLRKIPYQRPQPIGMRPDMLLPAAINLSADEHLWVPQGEGVWFKPLILNVSEGYYVNLLRVKGAGMLSRSSPFRAGARFYATRALTLFGARLDGNRGKLCV